MTINFVKWVGGGLGWAVGGPLGGVLGFIAGTVVDSVGMSPLRNADAKTILGNFAVSLLVQMAAVMKADGKVTKSELDYVKHFLKQNFGEKEIPKALILLKELLKKDTPTEEVCKQICQTISYSSRMQWVKFLHRLANIDGSVSYAEQRVLDTIAENLGVNLTEKYSFDSGFLKSATDAAYAVLEINRNASVIDIKKAYRAMAVKHHPDKVAYLGSDIRKAAEENFRKVNHAYEQIKKERNFV